MTVFAPDVSEYQVGVDDTFNRRWLILRICDGAYIDAKARHNLAWSIAARAAGKIDGLSGYVVYRPEKNAAILANLDDLGVPDDCVVMIDAESWGGQITGDHSTELNALADALRKRQGGRGDLVWRYGNRGPDAPVWQHPPTWLHWVVASYGGAKPDVPNLVGWQYTNGQATYDSPDRPHSTPPFGRCDHNALYDLPEADMPLDPKDPVIVALEKQIAALAAAVGNANERLLAILNGDTEHPTAGLRDLEPLIKATNATVSSGGVDASAVADKVITAMGSKLAAP